MSSLLANGIPIARIFGLEIRVHVSWIFIVAIITTGAADQLSTLHPEWSDAVIWVVSGAIAFLFFASVLIHELAHGLAAQQRGLAGGSVTLLFFGGTTALAQDTTNPGDEAAIAAAGPVASLAIGAAFLVVWQAVAQLSGTAADAISDVGLILGILNLLLGVLNLVPVFPLDGGRVLRAVLWRRLGDETRANRYVAIFSRVVGYALVAGGFLLAFADDALNGVMLVLSGWFLASAARSVERRAMLEQLLRGVRVETVMEKDLPQVSPQLTLDTFAAQYLNGNTATSLPVVRDQTMLGLIGISQLRRIGRKAWPTTRAADVMVSPPTLPTLGPDDELWSALERLRRAGLDGLPVMRGAELLGVLTRRSVVAAVQARARPLTGAGAAPAGQ